MAFCRVPPTLNSKPTPEFCSLLLAGEPAREKGGGREFCESGVPLHWVIIPVQTVCLQEFDNASIKKTTTCQHEFCEACLNKWLETNNTCPMCRTVLKEDGINFELFARTYNVMLYFHGIGGLTYSS